MTRQVQEIAYSSDAVALLDMIRFKNKVEEAVTEPRMIAVAFDFAQMWLDGFRKDRPYVHTHTFSDTTLMCLEEPNNPYRLADLVSGVSVYQCDSVLQTGDMMRGGLAVGPNLQIHGRNFGPAVIEAYQMEKIGDWPRVLIAPSALRILNPFFSHERTKPFILMDDRGLSFVDYLMEGCLANTAHHWADDYCERFPQKWPTTMMMDALLQRHKESTVRLRDAAENPRELSRCHALAAYHNGTVSRLSRLLACMSQDDALGDPLVIYMLSVFRGDIDGTRSMNEPKRSFFAAKLRELSEWQSALNGLAIDLPNSFPTLYGREVLGLNP